MKTVVDAYKHGEYFFDTAVITQSSTQLPRSTDIQYRDIPTQIIYTWDGQHYRDRSFHQAYTYYDVGQGDRIDTNKIYLARPGQRILGVLNGVDEETCSLTKNLNNTSELTFVVDRIIHTENGAEVSSFYDLISRHYEIYLPHHGWLKINEEPELDNNGNLETKSVRAESLEIELQQYDLVNFRINMATEDSKEMLATDNTYDIDGFTMFRDNILFYRDVSKYITYLQEFEETSQELSDLQDMLLEDQLLLSSPRIQYSTDGIDSALTSAAAEYRAAGDDASADDLEALVGKITEETPEEPKKIGKDYPLLLKYMTLVVDQTGEDGVTPTYSLADVLQREIDRQNELSLMYLILHEHGWEIGYVDPTVVPDSDIEDDRIPLAEKVGYFEKDSQDIYSFLTQDVSSYYRCIFVFDTENYLVNCYNINNIGYDTNIFLSFHNIQNEVARSSDRELYTVFHVQGAEELDFTEANLGEDWISDISYFLNEEHFTPEFIEKYNSWAETREQKRLEYIQASKDYRNANDIATEIYDRVPIDNADGGQYNTMTEDELLAEKANMEAEKRGYESLYVDDNGDFDQAALEASDDWKRYKVLTGIVLSSPLDALDYVVFIQHEESDDYEYGFDSEHSDYRLGNIDIALFNLRVIDGYYTSDEMSDTDKLKRTNVKNQKDYLDDYQYDFATYGDAYGVAELENQATILRNKLTTLDSTGYNESDGTIYDTNTYAKYTKYTNALASCVEALAVRQQEYDDAMLDVEYAVRNLNQLKADADITRPAFGFTTKELWLLDKYYLHTDYVNENILITSQSTNEQIVDTENQLYLDAMEQLYVESHPQYTWSTTQDNLLLMPEFQDWHGDMHVGNFIRVAMRDDYQVRLRISSITLNPLMTEPTIQIDFTTMTEYRSKRNDYTDLMASANASTKNQIGSTLSKSSGDGSISVDSALILKLLNNSTFASYMGNQSANVSGNAISAVSGSIDNLVSQSISAITINVDQITGTSAQFEDLWSNYISSNFIATKFLDADEAYIRELTTDVLHFGEDGITTITNNAIQTATISADQITSGTISTDRIDVADVITVGTNSITTIAEGVISTAEISADQITSGTIDTSRINVADVITVGTNSITTIAEGVISTAEINASQITSGTIDTNRINVADVITVGTDAITTIAEGTITTDNVVASLVAANVGDFDALTANSAFVQYLNSGVITAGTVSADAVIAALVEADVADIGLLTADTAFVQYLQSVSSTTATSVIDQGYIMNLVAGNISVADLATHTATADQIVLISQDGDPSIAFSGSTQQFYDSDGNVRVQIGQDGNGDFNFIVRGADGTTALFNENGITQSGIPNSTIVNNMITDGTIQKSKLGFQIVDTDENGMISITDVKDGSGGNFGVSYTTFQQNTTQSLSDLSDAIEDSANYDLYIETPNGTNIWGGNIQLNVKLLKNNVDVTNDFDASCFIWTRTSRDHDADLYWNSNHSDGAKVITITGNDVRMNADFQCKFEYENVTVVAG